MSHFGVRAVTLAIALGGCSGTGPKASWPVSPIPLAIGEVAWNPSHFDVGTVSAVTEDGDDFIVFSSKGASVFSSGAIAAVDPSVVDWRSASLLPAAGASGTWPSGVDAKGRVYRLRARSTLEDISDRYGLASEAVRAALPLGGSWIAFVLETSIAVADGAMVVRYDLEGTRGASGAAKRVAVLGTGGRVLVLAFEPPTLTTFTVPGALATAIDSGGHVLVQTADTIQEQGESGPSLVYRAAGPDLHGLATSGNRVWFGEGTKLGTLERHGVALGPAGEIAPGASLLASPSGAIWTLSGGKLARHEIAATGDEGVWQSTVRPIYAHVCSACHNRGGTAGIDFSTYDAWAARRSRIYDRVVVQKDMPQGGTLPDADIGAIGAWALAP